MFYIFIFYNSKDVLFRKSFVSHSFLFVFRKAAEFPVPICFQSQSLSLSTYLILDPMVALVAKNLPAKPGDARDMSSVPESGKSLEEGRAMYSSILAWRIP